MLQMARLSVKLQRFEVAAAVVFGTLVAAVAIVTRTQLDGMRVELACFDRFFSGSGPVGVNACTSLVQSFFAVDNDMAAKTMASMAGLPLVVGALLGVPLVSREIETGTAAMAWAWSGSRAVWLARRTGGVLAVLLVVLGVSAWASDVLTFSRQPWVTPGLSFLDAGSHGIALVARGFASFSLALLVGAAVGRVLPSLIIAVVLMGALWLGGEVARGSWLATEALNHIQDVPSLNAYDVPGGTYFAPLSRARDGTILTDVEAMKLAPPGVDPAAWLVENFHPMSASVPGSEYPRWLALEVLGYGAVAGLASVLVVPVLNRRRPG